MARDVNLPSVLFFLGLALAGGPIAAAPAGDTPLMLAVIHRDKPAIDSLLAAHADVRATNPAGTTALHLAIDDPAVSEALLAAGADPNAADIEGTTPLMLAAQREDGAAVVLALLAHGGDAKKLGASIAAGETKSLMALLDHGANPRAPSALQIAASRGLTDNVRLLLDRGADIDGVDPNGRTALMWAAQMGQFETATLLLNRGADPDLRETFNGTTALMQAAAADRPSELLVNALLGHGADVKLLDGEGANAVTWARRTGQQKIVQALIAHGSPPNATVVWTEKGGRVGAANTAQAAVARAIPILESTRVSFRNAAQCASCHSDAFPGMALASAQERGFRVDARARAREAFLTASFLAPRRESYRQGVGFADIAEAAYLLAGLAAGDFPKDETTGAVCRYLIERQSLDGSWHSMLQRVPSDGSDVSLTAMSIRALSVYGASDRGSESIARARVWLSRVPAATGEDLAYQALGLHWANASAPELAPVVAKILARQRDDGGFSQRDGMDSDAYATALAAVALRETASTPQSQAAVQRAVKFLLERQLDDGSWFVATRALRFQPFIESGFPQGRSQYMSAIATSWAVMALTGPSTKIGQEGR